MISQEQLWLQYLSTINESVQLQAGEALQVVYPFQSWDWGGETPLPNSYDYQQWAALNVVPSDPSQNADADAAASQSGFDVAYNNWFNTLAIGDLATDKHYEQLQDQLNETNGTYTTDYDNAQDIWKEQTNGVGSFQSWLTGGGGFAYNDTIQEDMKAISGIEVELDNYRKEIQSPLNNMTAAFNNPDYQTYATNPGGTSVQLRLWTTDPAYPATYCERVTDQNFGGPAKAGNSAQLSLTTTSNQYQYQQYYGEGGGGLWADFIELEAGGSFQQIDWSNFQQDYTVVVDLADLSSIPVTPSGWYAGTNITTFGPGPYATGFSAYQNGNDKYFFGPGGALSRIYTSLVVAYQPKVTITAGSAFTNYLKQQWDAEAGIAVGPFLFEAEASGKSRQDTAVVVDDSLVLQSKAPYPMILAKVSAWTLPPKA